MKRMAYRALVLAIGLFAACRKPEKPWQLPEASGGRVIEANTGTEYDTVVFVSMELGTTHSKLRREWDLLLHPRGSTYQVWLNAAMYAFAAQVSEVEWQQITQPSPSLPWKCDLADTAALPSLQEGDILYFILDRDRGEAFYRQLRQRYRKVRLSWQGREVEVLALSMDGRDTALWRLPVAATPIYLSLDKPGTPVEIAPAWRSELVLTRYIHPFYDQPEEFRWYPVLGALLGDGVEAAAVRTAETPYQDMDFAKAQQLSYSSRRDLIGYDWKRYDFNTGTYTVDLSRYFVIRTAPMTYYKLRFIDFYDGQGRKGNVKIEYEPL